VSPRTLAPDRGEWGGTAAAVVLHVVLIAALTTSLAHVPPKPEPKPMEVEIVDSPEVALTAAAPEPAPAPAATAPEPSPVADPIPEPAPQPTPMPPQPQPVPTPPPPQPRPQPAPQPTPKPRPAPSPRPAPPQPRPAPPQPRAAPKPPQRPTSRPLDGLTIPSAPRRSQLGADFLKGLGSAPSAKPAQSAASYSAEAKASVASTIAAQAQRCANRQPFLGEGADQLRLQVRLSFAKSGNLLRPPAIMAMDGPSDLQAKYGDRLEDQVRAIFADCAPFRLPPELYDTGSGGWKETVLRYRVRK